MDGLLGVAGMIDLIVSQWIIPENSLLSTSNNRELKKTWVIGDDELSHGKAMIKK